MQTTLEFKPEGHRFWVFVTKADGKREQVCRAVPGKDAALGFWHFANNFSAKAGITDRVEIRDGLDKTVLLWTFERGYSYDGKTFSDKPVLMDS